MPAGARAQNRYRDCSAVIVIGREELPPAALKNQGRALFGETPGAALTFLAPNAASRTLLPQEITPYLMADGSGWGAMARQHPDAGIRALQRQARECGTRQLVERLGLAHASYRKRVILGSSVPIPDLPVDRLVSWTELCPARLADACPEAFLAKGAIRLSSAGLHADAPGAFPTLEAARTYWKRAARAKAWRPSRRWPRTAHVRIRLAQKHAKPVDALVLADTLQAAHAAAIRAFGPLAEFRFLGMAPP